MCIKNFQSFNIGCNHCNNISFLLTFKFCWTQHPKCSKYFISQNCQKLKRNIVIAVLFKVTQYTTQYTTAYNKPDYKSIRHCNCFPYYLCNAYCTKNSYTHSANKSKATVYYCQKHYKSQRAK